MVREAGILLKSGTGNVERGMRNEEREKLGTKQSMTNEVTDRAKG